jgi:hypothetical protein
LDASVHFVVDIGPEVLIFEGSFFKLEAPVGMSRSDHHILQVTFAPLVADRTVVGVIGHETFYHCSSEIFDLLIVDRDNHSIGNGFHTAHYNTAGFIVGISVTLYSTESAGTYRSKCGMVAKIGNIYTQFYAGSQQVFAFFNLIAFAVDIYSNHVFSSY